MHMKPVLVKLREALISILPITAIVLILAATPLVDFTATELIVFSVAAVFLMLGIALFNLGADLAMTPMGEHVGAGLTKSKKIAVLLVVCFVMGVLITIAEPDLTVLAEQVENVINNIALISTVGVGVGLFLVIAVLKIVLRKDLSTILIFFYMLLFMFCALLIDSGKNDFLGLAFDSGGVTTGPITVPFIMALGVGIATTVGGKDSNRNSFGLVALCSIGPVIAVLILALASNGKMTGGGADYSVQSGLDNIGHIIGMTTLEVLRALGLIILFFVVLQLTVLKLPRAKIIRMVIGIAYTFVGLILFLTAVKIGFMPIGFKLGNSLAKSKPALIAIALALGMVTVLAEPAIHVLNRQVEEITGGGVSKKQMLIALSIGVGLAITLSVVRIIFDFSLLYYIIPGYCLSLGLSFFVPKLYTAIAFDSGGVASGPLTSGFILPFAVGACTAVAGEESILSLAFGVVAMVAMIPLITIQALGFKAVMSEKARNRIAMRRILSADDEQIINFSRDVR